MVKEDGEYIKLDKYKTGSSFVGDKESVTSKEVVLYETIPDESDVITAKKVATVPKNAQVSIEYIQNGSFRGSIYIDYKGTKGWTTIEDSVDAIDYSYPDDYDYMEVYVESGDVVEPSPEKPRPKVKRDKTKL